MEKISRNLQLNLLAEMGIQRMPRKRLADHLGIAEFTLRKVLDGETPVEVSKRTSEVVNDWLNESRSTNILH